MKKKLVGVLFAAVALTLCASSFASASAPPRGPRGNGRPTWFYDGGTPTAPGDSVDAGKKSNAYTLAGGYVYPRNYNPTPSTGSWNFSYKTADLKGAGQVFFAVLDWDGVAGNSGSLFFLDPYWCPGASSGTWSTTNFSQVGSSCTIYDAYAQPFTGTDAVADDPSTLTNEAQPATSALSLLLAAHPDWAHVKTYSFVTQQDSSNPVTVDRVAVAGSIISEFGASNPAT